MQSIIALDVDDIIISFIPRLIFLYNKDFKDNLKIEQITDWNLLKFVNKKCGKKIYDYIESPDIYSMTNPVKDSLWGVNTLKELGYRVIYVTVNNYGNAKYEWLLNHGYMDTGKDFVATEDKSLIKADMLLDDNFKNIKNFDGIGWLMTRSWNLKYQCKNRVKNWKDFIKKIKKETA
jgi:5'(3')-deoxyribonucleotidase